MLNMKTYKKADFTQLFGFVENLVSNGTLPCAVTAVTTSDEIVDIKPIGKASDSRLLKDDDIFLLFSVTKPIVSLAVMKLWDLGILHLNEPVAKYIPGFEKNGKNEISIWHLLTHTSGINQQVFERILLEKPIPEIDIVEEIINAEIIEPPGNRKMYNNLGFSVLGEIISRVSGVSLDSFLQEYIFQPLGMDNTFFYTEERLDMERYVVNINPFGLNVESFYKGKYPAGALFSTAHDLILLTQAILQNGERNRTGILSSAVHQRMSTPQTIGISPYRKVDFNGMETGLGWLIPTNSRSIIYQNIYGHHGAGGSMIWIYPEKNLALIFLSNYLGAFEGGYQWDYLLNVFSSCL